MVEFFKKNDEVERRVYEAGQPAFAETGAALDEFFAGAETCFELGDIIYRLKRAPLVDAIDSETFRRSFFAIFQLFTRPGTFEYYLELFRAIFGRGVFVQFFIPSPGVLNISIHVAAEALDNFVARSIVNNAYVYERVVTHSGEGILFQTTFGPKTQQEINLIIEELYPAGIVVNASMSDSNLEMTDEDESPLTDEDGNPLLLG